MASLAADAAPQSDAEIEDGRIGRSALRKATWRLIPLIGLGYGVAYMDRINIGFASLTMNNDLHFSNTVYGVGAGIFFLSYSACEIPSNLLLYRFGARRWLARIMITWGLLAMAMMVVRTPLEFYAMRFLLGMAEAGFFPGVLYYLTQWFPANIRARTISRFYISLPLSSVLMGVISPALLNLNGRLGLRGWQWLFLVEGLPSVLLSGVFLKYLPNGPKEAKWLTEPERGWIARQLAMEGSETSGGQGRPSHATGVVAAIRDPRVWLFGLMNFLMLGTSYGTTFFLPAILEKLASIDTTQTGWIISGTGVLGAAGMLLNAWLSDRSGKSYRHIFAPALLESVCLLVIAFALNPWIGVPVIAGMYFVHNAMQAPLLATPTTFLKGKGAAAGLATINMVGILGGGVFPPLMGWIRDRTGNYRAGLSVLALTMLTMACVVLALRSMAVAKLKETNVHVHP